MLIYNLKKIIKESSIILCIFIFSFIVFDFLISLMLKKNSYEIYEQGEFGFYDLKKNHSGYELFGSKIFKVNVNNYGYRSPNNEIHNNKYKILFLGDSATYGMMKWEDSYPGIFQKISNLKVLNGGVPSYSPTTYIHKYKNALSNNLLTEDHIVILGLDISDVQDEAGHWFNPDFMEIKNIDHPINLSAFKNKTNAPKIDQSLSIKIKDWIKSNLKISIMIYRIIKFNFIKIDYMEPILKTSRSAFTWSDFDSLNIYKATEGDNLTRGFLPLGVEGGLLKIKENIQILKDIIDKNNGNLLIFTYPWPAQIVYEDKFDWIDYVSNICLDINCYSFVDVISEMRKYSKKNENWYEELFINGDIHLNSFGNEFAAKKILDTIIKTGILEKDNEN